MEIKTTPWYETRTLIPPQIEMLSPDGMIQYKKSFLKGESPKTATGQSRFIHYDANYVKYCFLKEFYQFLFDGIKQGIFKDNDVSSQLALLGDATNEFAQYCQEQTLEEDARELFRTFCKIHLFI
jgi:hypothetical protein